MVTVREIHHWRGKKVKILDLFCGCGGSSLGFKHALERRGLECEIVGVDIDLDACVTFQKNGVGQAIRADVRFSPIRMKQQLFDIIIGCPPCQGFTRMRGKPDPDDPRNALVLIFLKWVRKLIPRSVIFENVPWISDSNYCIGLIRGLRELGYECAYEVLNAADFGVPQRRKRFILIASIGHRPKLPEPAHASPALAQKSGLPTWLTVREAIEDLPALDPGMAHPPIPNHRAMRHSGRVLERIRLIPRDGGSRSSLPRVLQLKCHLRNGGHNDVYGRMRWDTVAPTLTSGCTNPSKGRFTHPDQNRGVTARECARLQSFSDSFVFYGSKTSISRQIGNAMPPLFTQTIVKYMVESWQ